MFKFWFFFGFDFMDKYKGWLIVVLIKLDKIFLGFIFNIKLDCLVSFLIVVIKFIWEIMWLIKCFFKFIFEVIFFLVMFDKSVIDVGFKVLGIDIFLYIYFVVLVIILEWKVLVIFNWWFWIFFLIVCLIINVMLFILLEIIVWVGLLIFVIFI